MSFNCAICCLSITGLYECLCCSLFIKSLINENKNKKKYKKVNSNIEEENECFLPKHSNIEITNDIGKPNIGIKPEVYFNSDMGNDKETTIYNDDKITDFTIKTSLETLYE